MAVTGRSRFVRAVVGIVALGALALLFVRSARDAREAPFTVSPADLSPWSLVVEPEDDPLGAWLALRPPASLAAPLGRQIFTREGLSVQYPNPAMLPVILRAEFDRALAGILDPAAVLELARAAGLESATLDPVCMGRRRVSEPGGTRAVYFLLFDAPGFDQFRRGLGQVLVGAGGTPGAFDAAALSPVLIVAGADGAFARWLPLRAEPDVDCLAPIELTG